MSTFWEEYRKRVTEGALKLSTPPKDIPQNILWLKAYVTERIENDKIEGCKYVGKSEDGTFGFTETLVNYLMYYSYEAGLKCREIDYKNKTKEMNAGLEKIYDILDDLGYIDYPEY